jgi:putative PIN family toxin of toxin-antitoxin system
MNKSLEKTKIVIDTCVLVSALRSKRGASFLLLRHIDSGEFDILLSTALLLEYEEVARKTAADLWIEPDKVEDVLSYLCGISVKPGIFFSWRPFLKDQDDDMILELAVAGSSDYIVTFNTSDFKGAESFGIGVLTPKEFLIKKGVIKP